MEWKDYIERTPAILLSDKKIRALLGDVFMNDQLSINLMMNAFSIGFVSEIRSHYPVDSFTLIRWTKKMVADFGVSEDKARWAIDTWARSITPKVLSALVEAEKLAAINQEEEQRNRDNEVRIKAEELLEQKQAEEAAQEEARRSNPDHRLKTREDYSDYYINPSLTESKEYIFIPCGFGQNDAGFLIHGIKKQNLSSQFKSF